MSRVVRTLAGWQYRFYDRMRHAEAFRVAAEPGTATSLDVMRGHHYALLVTFRRSGEPVPTPVLFGLDGQRLYFRTDAAVAKVPRIRNDPHVRVGPCNWRARPCGPLVEGETRLLPPADHARAYAVLRTNYTRSQRLYENALDRAPGVEIAYVEVTPR